MVQVERSEADAVVELFRAEGRDYRGLYYLWEQQQWEATQVDLAPDVEAWPELDPIRRRAVADVTAWSLRRAHAATGALVPFVDAAPTEEQQVFLTTQLVDEARQLVFLDRYRVEVMDGGGQEMDERLDLLADDPASAQVIRAIEEAGRELREEAPADLIEAMGVYHLGAVGAAGVVLTRYVVDALEPSAELPGWRAGMRLTLGDARRHLAFALRAGAESASGEGALRRGLDRVLPAIEGVLMQVAGVAPLPGAEDVPAGSRRAVKLWLDAVAGEGSS